MAMQRREFIQRAAAVGVAMGLGQLVRGEEKNNRPVRVGFIGVGGRGSGLLRIAIQTPGTAVPAVCDVIPARAAAAEKLIVQAGQPKPALYTDDEMAWKKLLARGDLDAVVIATPWNWHTPMATGAMEHGIYAGVEVPAALSVDECWQLVDTSERTGVPCMMLENWSFRRDNLALLQMVRQGLFGEVVHVHCAHSHDCIDHWFFDRTTGKDRWPAEYLVKYNRDQYPTHSVGPVLSWLDINCGDRFETITSTATASRGINAYFARKFGPDHPGAKRKYAQGDIVTSVLRTAKGKTVVVNYDMQLPRPYDNRWMLQGTLGVYSEDRAAIYLVGQSPKYHEWEPFEPYMAKYDHPWHRGGSSSASPGLADGHGGTDELEIRLFLDAARRKTPTPIDVYDSVTMSTIVGLSGESIARGGAPVAFPDFTRGKWESRRPCFGLV
jgi:predicted dehydrogenase